MTTAILRLNSWWNARQTSASEIEQSKRIVALESENATLREQLETERVKNRIQEVEREQLAAVIARDLERVKNETRLLGGNVVKTDLPGAGA